MFALLANMISISRGLAYGDLTQLRYHDWAWTHVRMIIGFPWCFFILLSHLSLLRRICRFSTEQLVKPVCRYLFRFWSHIFIRWLSISEDQRTSGLLPSWVVLGLVGSPNVSFSLIRVGDGWGREGSGRCGWDGLCIVFILLFGSFC
jgi:hypothetical protein